MKNFNKKIVNMFENVRLSKDDKRELFSRINLVIDQIEAVSISSHTSPIESPFAKFVSVKSPVLYKNLFQYVKQRKFIPSLVVMVLLFATGGISTAAERSLPGDSLYSIKINVNEQAKGLTAVTTEAKAKIAVENTERRLQEAVALSAQGRLTDSNKNIIQKGIAKSVSEVKNQVASLVAINNMTVAQDITLNFESSLKAHEMILESVSSQADNSAGNNVVSSSTDSSILDASSTVPAKLEVSNIKSILNSVKNEIASTSITIADMSAKDIHDNSDETKVLNRIKEVKTRYDSVVYSQFSSVVSPKSAAIIDNYVRSASTTINEAVTSGANNEFGKALLFLQSASKSLSDAESIFILESKVSNVEVKQAISSIDLSKLGIEELTKIGTTTESVKGVSTGPIDEPVSTSTEAK